MKGLGTIILICGLIGAAAALGMDTTVHSPIGDVNNIGLLQDRQNFLMIAGVAVVVGVLMILFGGENSAPAVGVTSGDPFDQVDEERLNERKRYAIQLGVERRDGTYVVGERTFTDLESAIAFAQDPSAAPPDDPAKYFRG
jgi:hypothetical protein